MPCLLAMFYALLVFRASKGKHRVGCAGCVLEVLLLIELLRAWGGLRVEVTG